MQDRLLLGVYQESQYGNGALKFPQKWDAFSDDIINFVWNQQLDKKINVQMFLGFEVSGGTDADRQAGLQELKNLFSNPGLFKQIEISANANTKATILTNKT